MLALPYCLVYFLLLHVCVIFNFTNSISRFPLLLVVSFDGFRYDYLDKVHASHFQRLISKGVTTRRMKNVFITKTFPNHFSIATGLYEESHGITANEMFDFERNETFSVRNIDPKWWDNGHVLPVWVANQMSDPDRHSGGMMWPGTNVLIHNQTAFLHVMYNKSIPWEKRVDIIMSWFTNEMSSVNCVFLYFEQPDSAGHEYGPNSREVEEQIMRADNITGYLIEKLQSTHLLEKLNMIILSDHGMAAVPVNHFIEMDKILNPSLYDNYGSSPVWNILPKEGHEEEVYTTLMKYSKEENFVVYKRENIPEEYHYKNGRWVLPLLIVASEGWGLVHKKPTNVTSSVFGQHGYNNSLPSMHPFFIAYGPSFKENYIATPFENIDLFPLMCHLLQIEPYESNGSLTRVWQILKDDQTPVLAFTTSWIIGVLFIIIIVFGGLSAAVMCAVKRHKRVVSSSLEIPVLSTAVRMDKNKSSPEELQLLVSSDVDEG